MHCSVLVELNQGHLLEPRYWVYFIGEVTQEGMGYTTGQILCWQMSAVLPCNSKPRRQLPDKIIGESACPKDLTHRPRILRGLGVNHDGHEAGVHWPAASLNSTRPEPV